MGATSGSAGRAVSLVIPRHTPLRTPLGAPLTLVAEPVILAEALEAEEQEAVALEEREAVPVGAEAAEAAVEVVAEAASLRCQPL